MKRHGLGIPAACRLVALYAGETGTRPSWLWLVIYFFAFTWGELFILPVGLSLFGRIAPEKFAASMISAGFAAACLGNLGAGALGTLWSDLPPWQFFAVVAGVAAVAAGLLLALVPWGRAVDPGLKSSLQARLALH